MNNNEEEIIIKCSITLNKIFFPKNGIVEDGKFTIFSANIDSVEEGEPHLNKYNTISIKGVSCSLSYAKTYSLIAKENYDSTWGYQYEIIYISEKIDLDSTESQRKYLETILTENQVELLFQAFKKPLDILNEGDIDKLTQIKGIGEKKAKELIEKYEESKINAQAYIELSEYGLTKNAIDKIVHTLGGATTACKKIKANPYILMDEVDGYGWNKADSIALASGIGEFSRQRVLAYIKYFLNSEALKGNSWVYSDDLWEGLDSGIGNGIDEEKVIDIVQELEQKKIIWISKDRMRIGLKRYYNLEYSICKELIRISNSENNFEYGNYEEKIKRLEKRQGWNFTEEQLEGIKAILENQVVLVTGSAGCVDCDTEFFNGIEWKRIADYKEDDLVLQYNKDGTANLVKPFEYVKLPCDTMWHFETKYGLDQCLSDEHIVVYETSKGNLNTKPFSEIKKIHEKSSSGFSGKFYTTFNYNGRGIELSEFEIRLMCAVICDGSFKNKYLDKSICRINIKKQRKKDRLEWILNNLGIDYRKEQYNPKDLEYNTYLFKAPRVEKEFSSYWYNCNNEQLKIICDCILNWDGSQCNNRRTFSTTSKQTADFVQFAFSACGMRATIHTQDRTGQLYKDKPQYIRNSIEYTVTITNRNKVSMGGFHKENTKTPIEEYKTKDGYKYCFKVPSHMLVLRRKDKIFITHNCGKTATVSGMLEVFNGKYSFAQCALSGRASGNLTDVTGEEGYTIHRLLGVDVENKNKFIHNRKNPLDVDVVILDELSMVGEEIFYSLIQAICNGTKLIMLGDIKQLESIGLGNLIKDMIWSGVIKTVELTKIHRQAEASGIITESLKASKKEQLVEKDFEGTLIKGELQDMEYDIFTKKGQTVERMVNHFKDLINKGIDPNDIQLIVPMKDRGETSAYNINNIIQDILIKDKKATHIVIGKQSKTPRTIYIGDRIINHKNNYQIKSANDNEVTIPIFNGDLGIVTAINKNGTIKVKFNSKEEVIIPQDHLIEIWLGYCITTHKMQGSSSPYVICGIDYSHYKLLTRELIYTMLTRAKKYCILCAENKALRYAINTSNVRRKQTFLCDLLQSVDKNLEEFMKQIKPVLRPIPIEEKEIDFEDGYIPF